VRSRDKCDESKLSLWGIEAGYEAPLGRSDDVYHGRRDERRFVTAAAAGSVQLGGFEYGSMRGRGLHVTRGIVDGERVKTTGLSG
jgi:hypothetical protein